MFETTIGVLHESPSAIVPLAVVLWFVVQSVRRSGFPTRLARYAVVFGALPPFCLFVLAELLGSQSSRNLARALLDGEIRLLVDTLGLIDAVTAALLEATLQFAAGILPSDRLGGISSWDPFAAVSALGFLAAVFLVQFVTGVLVTRLAGRAADASDTNEWLTVAGVVLFVSGLLWTFLQLDPLEFGRLELQTAVLASSMGLTTGVAASNLSVDLPVDIPANLRAWRSKAAETDPSDVGPSSSEASTRDTPLSEPHMSGTTSSETTTSRTTSSEHPTTGTSSSETVPSESPSNSDLGASRHADSLRRLRESVRSLRRR
ncbi:hypothetical protein [Haladaptatus sp. T7]|uniref:hypothetical protein n=1 Tax=Haladaptatus sp. T7 TaxID=2029368 RepID=UPI0021A25B53|nr:hypothetical protein [Haladaptatus sp. T7]GKZ16394.1 hypothetical protein HAL_42750 [Haladaptatus sp. T7]